MAERIDLPSTPRVDAFPAAEGPPTRIERAEGVVPGVLRVVEHHWTW